MLLERAQRRHAGAKFPDLIVPHHRHIPSRPPVKRLSALRTSAAATTTTTTTWTRMTGRPADRQQNERNPVRHGFETDLTAPTLMPGPRRPVDRSRLSALVSDGQSPCGLEPPSDRSLLVFGPLNESLSRKPSPRAAQHFSSSTGEYITDVSPWRALVQDAGTSPTRASARPPPVAATTAKSPVSGMHACTDKCL